MTKGTAAASADNSAAAVSADNSAVDVQLRPMRWQDIAQLTVLDADLFGEDAWSEATWWAELAERPRRHYLVAERAGQIAGYGGVDIGPDLADIMSLAVVPSARRLGLGRVILDELEAVARLGGSSDLVLEVRADNDAARALYADAGFEHVAVRPRYYQPGDVDAVILRKRLVEPGTTS